MRGSIVDFQGGGAPADVDAERLPGERLLEDALAEIAGEEEAVVARGRDCREQSQLGDAEVLRFVDDDMREWFCRFVGKVPRHRGEDARPGIEAPRRQVGTGGGEDRPELLPLF